MGYFNNIASAVTTIFEGLTITASHLLRKPITVQYPDRMSEPLKETLAPRYRGFLNVDLKICTACTLCKTACPIQCIEIGIDKVAPSPQPSPSPARQSSSGGRGEGEGGGVPTRVISKFNIDLGKCMYCGLCVEACPTGAVCFTRDFSCATKDLKDLTFKFIEEGKPVVPYKKGGGAA